MREACHLNGGWVYEDWIGPGDIGFTALDFYALRCAHSIRDQWLRRFAGSLNGLDGRIIDADVELELGEGLRYHRVPW